VGDSDDGRSRIPPGFAVGAQTVGPVAERVPAGRVGETKASTEGCGPPPQAAQEKARLGVEADNSADWVNGCDIGLLPGQRLECERDLPAARPELCLSPARHQMTAAQSGQRQHMGGLLGLSGPGVRVPGLARLVAREIGPRAAGRICGLDRFPIRSAGAGPAAAVVVGGSGEWRVAGVEGILQRLEGSGHLLFILKPRINQTAEAQFGPYAYRGNAIAARYPVIVRSQPGETVNPRWDVRTM